MHQQIRVKLHSSGTSDGPGAMATTVVEHDPLTVPADALVRLLDLLSSNGFNLRMAGGASIELGGEFVFAVDDDRTEDCRRLLESEHYRPRVLEPHHCDVDDRPGALADCLRDLAEAQRQVHEIFIGTAEPDGRIPIQVTTVRRGGEGEGHSEGHSHHAA